MTAVNPARHLAEERPQLHEDGPMSEDEPISRRESIHQHLSLVKAIACKIAYRLPPHVELDDLISAGTLGLLDAVDKYDQSKSNSFKRYAEIRIKGAILDELRAMDHVSRTVRRQTNHLERAVQEIQGHTGRKATPEEVARSLGTDLASYHRMLDKLKPVLIMSFEELSGASEDDRRDPMQMLSDPDAVDPRAVLQLKMLRELVDTHIEALAERQRQVVRLYYFDDMNLKDIGKIYDVTESRVSQLLSQAVRTLKRRIRVALSKDRVSVCQLD